MNEESTIHNAVEEIKKFLLNPPQDFSQKFAILKFPEDKSIIHYRIILNTIYAGNPSILKQIQKEAQDWYSKNRLFNYPNFSINVTSKTQGKIDVVFCSFYDDDCCMMCFPSKRSRFLF